MRRIRPLLVAAAVIVAAAPRLALAGPPEDEQRKQLLATAKNDPERFARLREGLDAFLALPPEEQERLRRLHRELSAQDPERQARLQRVLERYGDWLRRLPADDRRRVEQAADPQERLRVVKEIRERQWEERLPRADRERLRAASGKQRKELVREFRQRERAEHDEWQKAMRRWQNLYKGPPPTRLNDLPPEARKFVTQRLMHLLGPEERKALERAEGTPEYFHTLQGLVNSHRAEIAPRAFLRAFHD